MAVVTAYDRSQCNGVAKFLQTLQKLELRSSSKPLHNVSSEEGFRSWISRDEMVEIGYVGVGGEFTQENCP